MTGRLVDNDRFAVYNGIKVVESKPGYALAEMKITENHLNEAGIIQGGAIYTLGDYAFAAAANEGGDLTVSINSSISYFKVSQGKILFGEAKEIYSSKKLAAYEVDIFDDDKELIARLSVTGFKKGKKQQNRD